MSHMERNAASRRVPGSLPAYRFKTSVITGTITNNYSHLAGLYRLTSYRLRSYICGMEDGLTTRTYVVYRVDYRTNTTEPIGCVVDRRRRERHNNAADMLRLAQMLYGRSSLDSHIFVLRESSWPNSVFVAANPERPLGRDSRLP